MKKLLKLKLQEAQERTQRWAKGERIEFMDCLDWVLEDKINRLIEKKLQEILPLIKDEIKNNLLAKLALDK